jgi:hypothetical protein
MLNKSVGERGYIISQATGDFKTRAQSMASKYNMSTERIGTTTVEHIRPQPPPKPQDAVQPYIAPLENVQHSKPWTPRAVVRESWENSIDMAANDSNPWYMRASGFGGAIGGYVPTAVESVVHGIIAMPQLAVTETIAAGEHGARAYLLNERGSDAAVVNEILQSAQAAAEGIANTAGTVAMVGGVVGPKGTPLTGEPVGAAGPRFQIGEGVRRTVAHREVGIQDIEAIDTLTRQPLGRIPLDQLFSPKSSIPKDPRYLRVYRGVAGGNPPGVSPPPPIEVTQLPNAPATGLTPAQSVRLTRYRPDY